ncbi:MAG: acyl--CoA ligase [Firmicutes bacterium]|nr:acyl--CoA ligase [Bacillota bacterium]
MNLFLLLDIPAMIDAEHEIVVDGSKRLTYGALEEEVRTLAAALQARGVGIGDRIAYFETNRYEGIVLLFACALIGATYVPLNYRAREDELLYMLNRGEIKAIFAGTRYLPLVANVRKEVPTLQLVFSFGEGGDVSYAALLQEGSTLEPPFAPPEEVGEDDLAVLMYTSGTTSKPKPVMLTHNDLSAYAMSQAEAFDGTDRGAAVAAAPFYHIAGLTGLVTSVYSGRRTVVIPQFEPKAWLKAVQEERCTFAFLVPTMLKRLLDDPEFDHTDLSSLETVSYGAAPMPAPVIEEAIARFPKTIGFVNSFGMTETTSSVCVLGPDDHRIWEGTPEEQEKKRKRLRSVGKPLPDVEILIADEEGHSVPPGEVGRVLIRTQRAMKGYMGDEQATKAILRDDGFVVTDDMGYFDEDGYLFLVGRHDDMIIRGGENISPAEVEDVLAHHPKVADVAVIGIPSLEWGQEVCAVVVPKDPTDPLTLEELQDFCRERLASFKKPTQLRIVDDFPRTTTGKIIKKALRETYAS